MLLQLETHGVKYPPVKTYQMKLKIRIINTAHHQPLIKRLAKYFIGIQRGIGHQHKVYQTLGQRVVLG